MMIKEQKSIEFQREFKCEFCETGFDNMQGNIKQAKDSSIHESSNDNIYETNDTGVN